MSNILKIEGNMDAAAMEHLRPQIEEVISEGDDVVIDMADVSFIYSSGIGGIVFMYKRLKSEGFLLSLQNLTGQPDRILRYMRVHDLLAQADA